MHVMLFFPIYPTQQARTLITEVQYNVLSRNNYHHKEKKLLEQMYSVFSVGYSPLSERPKDTAFKLKSFLTTLTTKWWFVIWSYVHWAASFPCRS